MDILIPGSGRIIFHDIRPLVDIRAFAVELDLICGYFIAHKTLVLTESNVQQFIISIKLMDETLQGQACLHGYHESDKIILSVNRLGHVEVRGTICQDDNEVPYQELHFAYDTDQACLRPLWNGFHRAMLLLNSSLE